jgi:SAM-dependent methyltransferase
MTRPQIKTYYDATEQSETREDLKVAVNLIGDSKVAIDCGCGSGSDIAFLLANEFRVYAFDIEEDSIARCKNRFKGNENIFLNLDSFDTFIYPKASLVVADASLFFCPPNKFDEVWTKIYECLDSGDVFSGSFLGPKDSMAKDDYDKENIWPEVSVFTESQVRKHLSKYEIIRFTEHINSGTTSQGNEHDWHIYSVVAKKI